MNTWLRPTESESADVHGDNIENTEGNVPDEMPAAVDELEDEEGPDEEDGRRASNSA